ncbi:VOC family protein [Lacticaseibacillus nasuensis]|uniref:hypothetical protein n=1 Tax=Lacticaseibacillus nasuensis TaxID=944671 RepID=UPI00224659E2|nr:hypothetical protein [Lacticaseibacillus nasuensis]MCX2455525.1 hypothetical protein [Lacticaseibacillus nasuensis]
MAGALDTFANETRFGFVALNVAAIAPVVDWYHRQAGFTILRQDRRHALLGIRANQQALLAVRQPPQPVAVHATAGLQAVTIMVPNRRVIGSVYGWFAGADAEPPAVFRTGLSTGFAVRDPAGNRVNFAYDEGSDGAIPVKYDWRDWQERPAAASRIAPIRGSNHQELPTGTSIGAAALGVTDFTGALQYLTAGIGFTLQGQAGDQAWLTVGDATHHIGLTVSREPTLARRGPDDTGLDYINLVVPTASALELVAATLDHSGLGTYHYDEARHYLNATGPNGITFWFSVA